MCIKPASSAKWTYGRCVHVACLSSGMQRMTSLWKHQLSVDWCGSDSARDLGLCVTPLCWNQSQFFYLAWLWLMMMIIIPQLHPVWAAYKKVETNTCCIRHQNPGTTGKPILTLASTTDLSFLWGPIYVQGLTVLSQFTLAEDERHDGSDRPLPPLPLFDRHPSGKSDIYFFFTW